MFLFSVGEYVLQRPVVVDCFISFYYKRGKLSGWWGGGKDLLQMVV